MCSRQESNLHHNFRKVASYPLNDGSKRGEMRKLTYSFSPSAAPASIETGAFLTATDYHKSLKPQILKNFLHEGEGVVFLMHIHKQGLMELVQI
jgi:hypothetical protein